MTNGIGSLRWAAWLRALLVAAALLPAAAQAQAREPVRFAQGATVTTITGQVQGAQVREYLLQRQVLGQGVELTLSGTSPESVFVRVYPAGRGAGTELPLQAGANESTFRLTIPASGDYVIRVTVRNPEAERRAIVFSLRVALLQRVENTSYFIVDFVCIDRTTLRVLTPQDRSAARIERLGQAWVLPRVETPPGAVRFSDNATTFTSRGEEGILERRNLQTLRCRLAGR